MKVDILQSLTSKVTGKIKANKFIPLTQFIGVKVRDGKLLLCATDGSNSICSKVGADISDDVNISVSSELFVKLVNALPPEMEVDISFSGNNLVISNNSIDYHIPAISDDSGFIKYPEIDVPDNLASFDFKKFSDSYNQVQNCVDAQSLYPYLSAVYVSDIMLGTNNRLLAKVDCGDLFNQPVLLPLPLCEVMMQLEGDKIEFSVDNGYLTMRDDNTIIRGKLHDGLNEYPVEGIKGLFEQSIDYFQKVNVDNLNSILDRISLFISDFEDNIMNVDIKKDKLSILSISKSGYEELKCDGSEGDIVEQKIPIDVRLFSRMLKSFVTPSVEMTFLDKQVVAKKDNTQVICSFAAMGESNE